MCKIDVFWAVHNKSKLEQSLNISSRLGERNIDIYTQTRHRDCDLEVGSVSRVVIHAQLYIPTSRIEDIEHNLGKQVSVSRYNNFWRLNQTAEAIKAV